MFTAVVLSSCGSDVTACSCIKDSVAMATKMTAASGDLEKLASLTEENVAMLEECAEAAKDKEAFGTITDCKEEE